MACCSPVPRTNIFLGEFPLLVDGSVRVVGFSGIISHLRSHHTRAYDLDDRLSEQQHKDRTA